MAQAQPPLIKKNRRPEFVTVSIALIIVGSMFAATFLIAWERRGFVNTPPIADAGRDMVRAMNTYILFDGTGSYDPDVGDTLTYKWDFGDGHEGPDTPWPGHIYTDLGNYTVTLTVTDSHGATAADTINVTIVEYVAEYITYPTYLLNELFTNPNAYEGKLVSEGTLVRVENATVSEYYYSSKYGYTKFKISDSSTKEALVVYCESGVIGLTLANGDIVNVQGEFTWYAAEEYWEIKVRRATDDAVELGPPPAYAPVSISTLLYNPEKYYNPENYTGSQVRIENALVADAGYSADLTYGVIFIISDATATSFLSVIAFPNATRPLALTRNDKINVQGLFTWYNVSGYWGIVVRNSTTAPNATDLIEFSVGVDYELVNLSTLLRTPKSYEDTLVRVVNATVTDAGSYAEGFGEDPENWVLFAISDNSTFASIYVYCEGSASRPPYLSKNELINVQGLFTYYTTGKYWEIKVRSVETPDSNDKIEKACARGYVVLTLSTLLQNPIVYKDLQVRVECARVAESWSEPELGNEVRFGVLDLSEALSLSVFVESNGSRPEALSQNDKINVQGLFRWNYTYSCWEVVVRSKISAPNDLVEIIVPEYLSVTVATLLQNPLEYEDTMVKFESAIVSGIVWYYSSLSKTAKFRITDELTYSELVVYCEGYTSRPETLSVNAVIRLQGLFTWYQPTGGGGYWEILIRSEDTAPLAGDKVEFLYQLYQLVNISTLLSNTDYYEGGYVRVENATVNSIDWYNAYGAGTAKFYISDGSTMNTLCVYCEKYGARPASIEVGDKINAQGEFYNYSGLWEILVRSNTNDSVEKVPLEFFWTDHVVISELLYYPKDNDKSMEWIELYNPTSNEINIGNWVVEHWNGKEGSQIGEKITIPNGATIKSYGFYLLGSSTAIVPLPDYVPDFWFHDLGLWTPGAANDGRTVILKDSSGIIVDALGYGGNFKNSSFYEGSPATAVAEENRSLERKPGFNDPEHGNGIDTNNNKNDFAESGSPNPQNATNAPELPPSERSVIELNTDCPVSALCGNVLCNRKCIGELHNRNVFGRDFALNSVLWSLGGAINVKACIAEYRFCATPYQLYLDLSKLKSLQILIKYCL